MNARTAGSPRRTEKQIQADIVRALRALGCYVADLSQPRATMLPLGLPDLWWAHVGWRAAGWIEVKREGGRTRPMQTAWHDMARAAGVHVAICRSVADALEALTAAGAPAFGPPDDRSFPMYPAGHAARLQANPPEGTG